MTKRKPALLPHDKSAGRGTTSYAKIFFQAIRRLCHQMENRKNLFPQTLAVQQGHTGIAEDVWLGDKGEMSARHVSIAT